MQKQFIEKKKKKMQLKVEIKARENKVSTIDNQLNYLRLLYDVIFSK